MAAAKQVASPFALISYMPLVAHTAALVRVKKHTELKTEKVVMFLKVFSEANFLAASVVIIKKAYTTGIKA